MASVEESLESVAIGLLTLEVNTIKKCGMSAQKMPDVPIALHSIVDAYNDYLSVRGYGVDKRLRMLARNRIEQHPPPPPDLYFEKLMDWRPGQDAPQMRSVDLTNGAKSFEALRWAAEAALTDDRAKAPAQRMPEEERAVVARIMANCRQLSPVVNGLRRAYLADNPKIAQAVEAAKQRKDEALAKAASDAEKEKIEIAADDPAVSDPDTPVLIDGTLEQTAQACFAGNQKLTIQMNVAVLVRKVWDIGTETVLAQTSVQIDGDVVTRVSPGMLDEQRDFLLGLHNTSLQTGLAQWRALFNLAAELIGGLAQKLFKG